MVLIDSPPLLPVTDAAAVAPATDGVLLVCRFRRTSRTQVENAAGALHAVSAPLLGTVFTMVPSTGPRAYAPYNAYYRAEHPTPPHPGAGPPANASPAKPASARIAVVGKPADSPSGASPRYGWR
jgi:non-specific protein-tyrosine kinase